MTSILARSSYSDPGPELSCEHARLNCIRALKIMDAPAMDACTTLVECVANYFRVPIAYFSVIDQTRQYFKASVGLGIDGTSRDDSFCKQTIMQRQVYTVRDATKDPQYVENPFVWSDPFIKFYAGAPVLIDRRHAIGSLCIVDRRPRTIDESQKKMLKHFSVMLAGLIEIQHLDREKTRMLPHEAPYTVNG